MKNLIKAIATKEGKKHQASVGDIREILRILADIFVDGNSEQHLTQEFVNYCEKRGAKIMGFKVGVKFDFMDMGPLPEKKTSILFKKKKARMKKAKGT